MSVPKKDGKIQMCVDHRDLKRASPKDNFPLPHIDVLVDNTTNFTLFSFSMGLVWLLQEYLEFNISNIWWAWGINDRNWYCSFLRSHVMNCETSQQYLFQTQILLCLQDTLHKVNRDQCFCLQLICFVQLKLVE